MTSRERVLRAVEHKETDRLPRDFDAETPLVEAIVRRLGLEDAEDLKRRFKVDMERVWVRYNCPYTDGRNIYGVTYSFSDDGVTYSPVGHPLADATLEDVEAHRWPDPSWVDMEAIKAQVRLGRAEGRWVVCSSWGAIFGEAYRLMGMDSLLMALHLKPEVVHAIVRKLTDFCLAVDRIIFEGCRGEIDMAFYGNDFGTQRALIFRPEAFGEFFAGPLRELTGQARNYGLKTMMHSCGAVSDIMDDIIECGFDMLDPVQYTAEGMSPERLKARFGGRIAFHGGISTQSVLPLGTPDEVRAHVEEVCRIMKPGGGYVFCSDQTVTSDTPVENVIAMYDAIDAAGL